MMDYRRSRIINMVWRAPASARPMASFILSPSSQMEQGRPAIEAIDDLR
jgi:hypothetical protein